MGSGKGGEETTCDEGRRRRHAMRGGGEGGREGRRGSRRRSRWGAGVVMAVAAAKATMVGDDRWRTKDYTLFISNLMLYVTARSIESFMPEWHMSWIMMLIWGTHIGMVVQLRA
ncbi:unnamed protein product, partial [Musa hybrid cultivar]